MVYANRNTSTAWRLGPSLIWCLKWRELQTRVHHYRQHPSTAAASHFLLSSFDDSLLPSETENITQTPCTPEHAVPQLQRFTLFPDLPGPTGIIPGGGGPIIGIIGGPPIWGAGIMPGRGGPAEHIHRLVTRLAAFTFINNVQCEAAIKLYRRF